MFFLRLWKLSADFISFLIHNKWFLSKEYSILQVHLLQIRCNNIFKLKNHVIYGYCICIAKHLLFTFFKSSRIWYWKLINIILLIFIHFIFQIQKYLILNQCFTAFYIIFLYFFSISSVFIFNRCTNKIILLKLIKPIGLRIFHN